MPRLLRSWFFWLGLPGLIFLLWVWQGSTNRITHVYISRWDLELQTTSYSSLLELRYNLQLPKGMERFSIIHFPVGTAAPKGTVFPTAASYHHPPVGPYPAGVLYLAYWFLVLIYLVIWCSVLGLLALLWKRAARRHGDVPRGTP